MLIDEITAIVLWHLHAGAACGDFLINQHAAGPDLQGARAQVGASLVMRPQELGNIDR